MELFPWFQPLRLRLDHLIESGRLPHALLLSAPEGWGDVDLAGWLAKKLLQLDQSLDLSQLAHPDLRWIEPEKAIIRVDQIRLMSEFAVGTAQSAMAKVAIVQDVHCMNEAASNALLKTLEEPPPDTYCILATTAPGRLLPTIRSRCQHLALRPDSGAVREWIQNRLDELDNADRKWSEAEIDALLFEFGDAPLATLQALREGIMPLATRLQRALTGVPDLKLATEFINEDPHSVTGRWLRYIVAMQHGAGSLGNPNITARALQSFGDELIWVRRQLETSNSANAGLLFERLLVRWRALSS